MNETASCDNPCTPKNLKAGALTGATSERKASEERKEKRKLFNRVFKASGFILKD